MNSLLIFVEIEGWRERLMQLCRGIWWRRTDVGNLVASMSILEHYHRTLLDAVVTKKNKGWELLNSQRTYFVITITLLLYFTSTFLSAIKDGIDIYAWLITLISMVFFNKRGSHRIEARF